MNRTRNFFCAPAPYCLCPEALPSWSVTLLMNRTSPYILPLCKVLFPGSLHPLLEATARYAGLLIAPAEGFGLRPWLFLAFGHGFFCPSAKKTYYAVLAHFWFSVVTLVTFNSNLSNVVRNP